MSEAARSRILRRVQYRHATVIFGCFALVACAASAPVVEPPPIVQAAEWSSTPQAMPDSRRHDPVRITIHHAGVRWNEGDDPASKLRSLQSWGQRDKGWPDVPYHFLVAPDGRVFEGRSLAYEGETNTEYDVRGHALVQLWGNFEEQRVTLAQLESTAQLCAWLCREYAIDPATLASHRDWSTQTSCPGKDLYRYVSSGDLRDWVEEILRGEEPQVRLREPLDGGPVEFVPVDQA